MAAEITDKHRLFYINNILGFALFYDSKIIDKDTIIKNFLESSDWKFYERIWEVKKIVKTSISEDLKEVRVETK